MSDNFHCPKKALDFYCRQNVYKNIYEKSDLPVLSNLFKNVNPMASNILFLVPALTDSAFNTFAT